jgi:glycosyltransferase involved in cell wall biosynthesis
MHVLHVAPTACGIAGLFGGGERYPLELARALASEEGNDCELVTFGPTPAAGRDPSGLSVRALRPLAHLGGHPAHPLAPGRAHRGPGRGRGAHPPHPQCAGPPGCLGRAPGALLVTTDHGLGADASRRWARRFDGFLPVSRYGAAALRAPPARTRVVYGGADPARFRPDPATPRAGVLFVGRLTPHKGVDRLIRALPAGADLTAPRGTTAGAPERSYPDLLRSLAAGRSVRMTGAVAEAELPELHRRAAVFALPSVDRTCYGRPVAVPELLGLSALEAMASGTPVVASRIGGVPEVVTDGETGFLVDPGDVGALHDGLAMLLADGRLARRMGDAARAAVLDRFTWRACARRCLAAYRELVR